MKTKMSSGNNIHNCKLKEQLYISEISINRKYEIVNKQIFQNNQIIPHFDQLQM